MIHVEIADLPIQNGGSFHSYVTVYQAGYFCLHGLFFFRQKSSPESIERQVPSSEGGSGSIIFPVPIFSPWVFPTKTELIQPSQVYYIPHRVISPCLINHREFN